MFKKTMNFSELKTESSAVAGLKDGEVIQVIHRGNDIKVMMTQEYFFSMMAQIEKNSNEVKVTPYDPNKLLSDFESKLKRITDVLDREEPKKSSPAKVTHR